MKGMEEMNNVRTKGIMGRGRWERKKEEMCERGNNASGERGNKGKKRCGET